MVGQVQRKKRRKSYTTAAGEIIEVVLTRRQHQFVKTNKIIYVKVRGTFLKIVPPIKSVVLKKIKELQDQIKALKKEK